MQFSQFAGGNHFHIRPIFEDVHDQFTGVAVGDVQFIAAVTESLTLLLRVPLFIGDPAGGLGTEAQVGGVFWRTGEDAIAFTVVGIEFFFAGIVGGNGEGFDGLQAVEGEAAQLLAPVAKGVEVPVAAIVDEALRGDGAFAGLVACAAVVENTQSAALQDGAGDLTEMAHCRGACGHLQDADAAADVGMSAAAVGEQVLQTFFEGGDGGGENTGLEFVEQVLRDQQGVKFFSIEPEARQFVEASGVAVVIITVAIRVVFQWYAQRIAQLANRASYRGFRAVQFGLYGF